MTSKRAGVRAFALASVTAIILVSSAASVNRSKLSGDPGVKILPGSAQPLSGGHASAKAEGAPSGAPAIAPYVGDWVGTGWSWEVRFRQSARDFTNQFVGGAANLQQARSTIQNNVMELVVKEQTSFEFNVDSSGNITGKGEINYDLSPNLCGLAALAEQANEHINMMKRLPSIFQFMTELGTAAIDNYSAEWQEAENELASDISNLAVAGETVNPRMAPYAATGGPGEARVEQNVAHWFEDMGQAQDARALGLQTIFYRCGRPGIPTAQGWQVVGGLPCDIISSPPVEKEAESIVKGLGNYSIDNELETIGEVVEKKMEGLDQTENAEINKCSAVGPTNFNQFVSQMESNFASTYIAGLAALGPAGTGALLGAPVGMMLSIPGVTQVTYSYKGLVNGPEKRGFPISGHIVPNGSGAKMYLQMGDVQGGSNQLQVEYSVNYKRGGGAFPTFSPFLSDPGDVSASGTLDSYKRQPAPSKGKTGAPQLVTVKTTQNMPTPFASFHAAGAHRNGVPGWHEYEYYWYAYKVTQPAAH